MGSPSVPAGSDPAGSIDRFRTLAGVTIAATVVLIIIGGVVRVSDSGLGCGPAGSGTHGWPLCTGSVIPAFLEGETAIEFSHRIAAGIVGVLIALMLALAWRRLREQRAILRGSVAAMVLVLAQAVLGGLTVENDLDEVLVAAHLLLAMVLLALLVWLRSRTDSPQTTAALEPAGSGLRRLAAVAAILVLATIVAGGYVAGTEGEGTASEPVRGAHLACGQEFPGCLGEFMPFGKYDDLVDAHLTHRALMYLAALSVLALAAFSLRSGRRDRLPLLALAVLISQILLGALNVWEGKHAGLIVAHLTIGTLLWTLLALNWIRFDSARG